MIVIKIPLGFSEKVLYKAGYVDHPKGTGLHGYIRDLGRGSRFHAYTSMARLEIHQDQTFGFKHKVVLNHPMEKRELHRIQDIYYALYPEAVPPKVYLPKTEAKRQVAPNLQELQRMASSLNP